MSDEDYCFSPKNPFFSPDSRPRVTDQDGNPLNRIVCPKCDTVLHNLSHDYYPKKGKAWQCSACYYIIVWRDEHGRVEFGDPGREVEKWNKNERKER